MARTIFFRILQSFAVIWASFTIAFVVLNIIPGDPVRLMLSSGGEVAFVDPALVEKMRVEYGFDKPVAMQYLDRLVALVQGDLGRSIQGGRPVADLFVAALPPTLQLGGMALVIGIIVGCIIGFVGTYVRNETVRWALLSLPSVAVSIPTFWVGLVLIQVVSFRFGLLPAYGSGGFRELLLPAITLSVPVAAAVGQVLARGMLAALDQPYVGTAKAKGASRLQIHAGHVLRNAAIPALTVGGVLAGNVLAGAVVVETVFGRNGFGRVVTEAVMSKDIAVVQGAVVVSTVIFVVVNLLVDLCYPLIDPRLRTRSASAGAPK